MYYRIAVETHTHASHAHHPSDRRDIDLENHSISLPNICSKNSYDMALLLLDHLRKERLECPIMSQRVDGEGSAIKLARVNEHHTSFRHILLNVFGGKVEQWLSLNDTCVVNEHCGVAELLKRLD